MASLTYTEYGSFGCAPLTVEEFDRLINKAETIIQSLTSNYYVFNDITLDTVVFRVNAYKKAIAYQIEHMSVNGINTSMDVLRLPSSQSIGQTSISYGSTQSEQSKSSLQISIISMDAIMVLEGTGLLHRGVC